MQASASRPQVVSFPKTPRSNTVGAPVLLSPTFVERMLAKRRAYQVVKFRTTCSDCVPNL